MQRRRPPANWGNSIVARGIEAHTCRRLVTLSRYYPISSEYPANFQQLLRLANSLQPIFGSMECGFGYVERHWICGVGRLDAALDCGSPKSWAEPRAASSHHISIINGIAVLLPRHAVELRRPIARGHPNAELT